MLFILFFLKAKLVIASLSELWGELIFNELFYTLIERLSLILFAHVIGDEVIEGIFELVFILN